MINPSKQVEGFFSSYPVMNFRAGELIVGSGQTPEFAYFIETGIVRQYDVRSGSLDATLNVFNHHAFFSVVWLLTEQPNRYNFSAFTDVRLRRAPVSEVRQFLVQNPQVTYELLTRIARGLDGLMLRMTTHMHADATSRLATEIFIEAKRFGKTGMSSELTIKLPVQELAARSGLARETASRQLAALIHKQLVIKRGRTLIVPDVIALEQYINSVKVN